MGMKRENRNTPRENCPSVTLSITDLTGTGIRSNKDISSERTVTNHLHGPESRSSFQRNLTIRFLPLRKHTDSPLHITTT